MLRTSPKPDQIYEVYLDESSQNNHRYLVLGAIVVPEPDRLPLQELTEKAKPPDFLTTSELKWTKVSRTKLDGYRRIVDLIFDNPSLVHFHSLFVDPTKIDHAKYNDGSRDIGFNKEIYQLAMKVSQLYNEVFFHLYPDQRETTQMPDDLRLILNRGARKNGDNRDWPFRRCQFRKSHDTLLLQIADIFTGAIAFDLNGHGSLPSASNAKITLSKHVLDRAGIPDTTRGTARARTFTIWPRKLR